MQPDAPQSNRLLKCLPVLLFTAAMPLHAFAQAYPNKPLRMLVPYPPGGASDVIARILGQHMGETFRQQVIIDNRAGANGMIATQMVAQAAPDGYTLLMSNVGPSAINPSIYAKVPYDAIKDFAPVSLTHVVPLMLVVNSTLGVNSVAELVARAKAAPGKLTYGTGGTGTAGHMAMELFMPNAGIRMERVSYKGDGLALNDILGNQITTMFTTAISGEALVQSGRLKALAVTTAKRLATKPDVPTVAELGMPGYEVTTWGGVMAPANTPRPLIAKLNAEINRILKLPEVRERFAKAGAETVGSTPEEFRAYVVAETEKWAKVAKSANIRVE
jgi:tripartite-type tricarboxylate transporter receptor subunit TctC